MLRSLRGFQAHICHHAGEEHVSGGIQRGHGDGLSLQVADGADLMCPEQFEAAEVEPRQEDDGVPRLQPEEGRRREESIEVCFTRGEGFLDAFGPLLLEVVHLGEPFAAQQFFGHVLGGLTDAGDLDQPDPRRLLGGGSAATRLVYRPSSPAVPVSVIPREISAG